MASNPTDTPNPNLSTTPAPNQPVMAQTCVGSTELTGYPERIKIVIHHAFGCDVDPALWEGVMLDGPTLGVLLICAHAFPGLGGARIHRSATPDGLPLIVVGRDDPPDYPGPPFATVLSSSAWR